MEVSTLCIKLAARAQSSWRLNFSFEHGTARGSLGGAHSRDLTDEQWKTLDSLVPKNTIRRPGTALEKPPLRH
jgi:hypothetical protein